MATPSSGIVSAQAIDAYLSELAQGFTFAEGVADQFLTPIKVNKYFGKYLIWDEKCMKISSSLRGMGAQAVRNSANFTYGNWQLPDGYTREVAVDVREDKASAGMGQLNLGKQQLWIEQEKMALEREKEGATILTTAGNYNLKAAVTTGWNQTTADIFKDIKNAKEQIRRKIGTTKNLKLLVTPDVWISMSLSGSLQKFFLNSQPGAALLDKKQVAGALGIDDIVEAETQYIDDTGARVGMYGTGFAALIKVGTPAGSGVVDPSALPPAFGWGISLTGHPFVDSYEDISRTSLVYRVNDNWVKFLAESEKGSGYTNAGYLFQGVIT